MQWRRDQCFVFCCRGGWLRFTRCCFAVYYAEREAGVAGQPRAFPNVMALRRGCFPGLSLSFCLCFGFFISVTGCAGIMLLVPCFVICRAVKTVGHEASPTYLVWAVPGSPRPWSVRKCHARRVLCRWEVNKKWVRKAHSLAPPYSEG